MGRGNLSRMFSTNCSSGERQGSEGGHGDRLDVRMSINLNVQYGCKVSDCIHAERTSLSNAPRLRGTKIHVLGKAWNPQVTCFRDSKTSQHPK